MSEQVYISQVIHDLGMSGTLLSVDARWQARAALEIARQLAISNDRQQKWVETTLPAHPETANPPTASTTQQKEELLSVIKTLLHWMSPEPGKPEDPRPLSEVVKHAREVIAKAEGR